MATLNRNSWYHVKGTLVKSPSYYFGGFSVRITNTEEDAIANNRSIIEVAPNLGSNSNSNRGSASYNFTNGCYFEATCNQASNSKTQRDSDMKFSFSSSYNNGNGYYNKNYVEYDRTYVLGYSNDLSSRSGVNDIWRTTYCGQSGSGVQYGSVQFTIPHDSDGNKTISISSYFYGEVYGVNSVSTSETFTLPTIPLYTKIGKKIEGSWEKVGYLGKRNNGVYEKKYISKRINGVWTKLIG